MDPYKMAWIRIKWHGSATPLNIKRLQYCTALYFFGTYMHITQYVYSAVYKYYCITLCVMSHNIQCCIYIFLHNTVPYITQYTVLCVHIIVQHCALYHTIYSAVYTYYCITLYVISHNIQCCIYTLCVMSLCTRPVLHVTRILLTMMMISADLIHCFYDIM